MKAVFLDRDGTIIVDPPDLRVDSIDELRLFPDTIEALTLLQSLDYDVFLITNQAGIGEGRYSFDQFHAINTAMLKMFEPSGIKIQRIYMCPHLPEVNCSCRKPQPKMLLEAAEDFDIDLANSYMIGDRQSDIMAGVNAGTKTILVKTGNQPIESAEATYTANTLLDAIKFIDNYTNI